MKGGPQGSWRKLNVHSAWEFVGSDVSKVLKSEPKKSTTGSQIVAVMVVAINPPAFAEAAKNEKARELARVFVEFYAKEPDLTLRLLSVIRKKWNDQSVTALVQRHILAKAYHQRPKFIKNKFVQQAVFHRDATVKDIQAVIPIKAIEAEAVKKARLRIRPPSWRPMISTELNSALQELRDCGFDVGLGW